MTVYRAGPSFRIDSIDASNNAAGKRFADAHPDLRVVDDVAQELERITLEYRRWWAEGRPEVRWAAMHATGAYVVDVSHIYWCDKTFQLSFEASSDASRFALLFRGLDQIACEAVVAAYVQMRAGHPPPLSLHSVMVAVLQLDLLLGPIGLVVNFSEPTGRQPTVRTMIRPAPEPPSTRT